MAIAFLSTKNMPLPIELFYGAMKRQVPLADYARTIDLPPDVLRQALTGRLQSADPALMNALATAVNRDLEQVDLTTVPYEESFSLWLKRNMEGITQHALRARAQLDIQTLKRFLNGDLLPDSDQAERISRALYIDRMEIARVITANMAAASPSVAGQESPEPRAMGRQSTVSTEVATSTTADQSVTNTGRRRASPGQVSAEAAPGLSAVAPTTIDNMALPTIELDTTATADSAKVGKRPKRTPKPKAQLPDPVAEAMATPRPHYESSSLTAIEAQEADRDDGAVSAVPPPPLIPAAVNQAAVLAPPVAAKAATEREAGTRRPKRSTTRGPVNVTAAEQPPALTETQVVADERPMGGFAAEDKSPTQASSRRRPRIIEATVTEPALSTPQELSAGSSMDRTAPMVTAELAADTTTLRLSAEEARLIRRWRQLHPHGRRATLQYIGSLLLED